MKTAAYFDKFSKEYESQDRYRYLFYRWMVDGIIRQVDRGPCDILDIGTGTGNLAIRLAMRRPDSRVLGVDLSRGMISEAKAKCVRMGVTNVRFEVGPVEKLRNGKADFAVSALAFHHIKDKGKVVSDILARLPEDGKLVIGDWFVPSGPYEAEVGELRRKDRAKAREFDRSWKDALKGMSERYGTEHPKEYPVSQTDLAAAMKDAGFSKSRVLKSLLPNFAIVVGAK